MRRPVAIGIGLVLAAMAAGVVVRVRRPPAAPAADTTPLDASGEKELKTLKARGDSLEQKLEALKPRPSTTYIVIDTGRNLLSVYENGRESVHAVCSTGSGRALVDPARKRRWVFDTPRGEFFIDRKSVV